MARFFSRLSIRWRLTATYVALVVAIVLVLGLALYRGLETFLLEDAATRTTADVQRVVDRELDRGRPGRGNTTLGRLTIARLGRTLVTEVAGRDTSVVVLWPDHRVIASSDPIPDVAPWPVPTVTEMETAAAGTQPVRRIDDGRQPRAMLLIQPVRGSDGTILAVTAVSTSLEGGDSALAQLRTALIVGVIVAILLGIALGLPITRIALRPLDRVVGAAQRISAGESGVRVGAADAPTEIARLGVAFDTMVDRLEASAEAQRRFVADASHELRTPLAALGGMTEMLLLGIDQGDEAAVERILTAMNREIGRLGRLASDLLLLSQLEDRGGRLPLTIGEVPLAEVAAEVVTELNGITEGRMVSVTVAPGLVVTGDRDRLKQVLLNLVENAARHTEAGGSIVIAATPATETTADDAVRISVTDDGTGLAPEDVDRIFDRFYRADQARVRAGGAGLGLSIVKAIAEAHGGRAEASSPGPGQGTTVSVILPATPAAETLRGVLATPSGNLQESPALSQD